MLVPLADKALGLNVLPVMPMSIGAVLAFASLMVSMVVFLSWADASVPLRRTALALLLVGATITLSVLSMILMVKNGFKDLPGTHRTATTAALVAYARDGGYTNIVLEEGERPRFARNGQGEAAVKHGTQIVVGWKTSTSDPVFERVTPALMAGLAREAAPASCSEVASNVAACTTGSDKIILTVKD